MSKKTTEQKESFIEHFKDRGSREDLEKVWSLLNDRIKKSLQPYLLPGTPKPDRETVKKKIKEAFEDEHLQEQVFKYLDYRK